MAIDDPREAFRQQYMTDGPSLPNKLAKYAAEFGFKLAIPDGGLAPDLLLKVADVLFDKPDTLERVNKMFELFSDELKYVEKTKVNHEDVKKAIQLAIWYDRHERDNAKRERFVKLIGNAIRSDEQIHDIATFIQTLEQLNERDFIVLKVLNKVMNKDGDWNQSFGTPTTAKLHPTTMKNRAPEFTKEIAIALGQKIETNQFNREVGFTICLRLQGFGLAREVQPDVRELPLTDYSFQLTVQGIRLLMLLGEKVPNYANYMRG